MIAFSIFIWFMFFYKTTEPDEFQYTIPWYL